MHMDRSRLTCKRQQYKSCKYFVNVLLKIDIVLIVILFLLYFIINTVENA